MYSGSYHFLLKILTTVVTMCAFCCPSLLLEYRHWTWGYHFFTVCIVKQWNGLVREVVWSPSLELFKIQLSKVLSSLFLSPSWAYFVRHPEVLSSLYHPTILFHLDFRDNCMDIFLILNSFLHFELLHLKESTEFSLPMFLIKDWPCCVRRPDLGVGVQDTIPEWQRGLCHHWVKCLKRARISKILFSCVFSFLVRLHAFLLYWC